MIPQALELLKTVVDKKYLSTGHYQTGHGIAEWGNQVFYYEDGIVINVASMKPQHGNDWKIVAYHGTEWQNLESILKLGLLPGTPSGCQTFNGDAYGKGIYSSPINHTQRLTIEDQ